MRPPANFVIASFLFFATIAFAATPTSNTQKDPMSLISSANGALKTAEYPLNYLTSGNSTVDNVTSIIINVMDIVEKLNDGIKESSLPECARRCTGSDIVNLIATTVKIVWDPLDKAYDVYNKTKDLLNSNNFDNAMDDLRDTVILLVGISFKQALDQYFSEGSAHIMPEENPTPEKTPTPEKEPKPKLKFKPIRPPLFF